jgi:hypothetical protein
MYEDILKDMFSLKLKLIGAVTERLPEPVRGHIRGVQASIVKTVNEVTGEYLERNKLKEEDRNLKKVDID